jgi:pimeloyl-ACP methyl ester carboxylesterase
LTAMAEFPVRPYATRIPDAAILDLRERLARTRWPDEYADDHWNLGTDKTYLRSLCDYWATQYDWRAQEARLNEVPQFVATVDNQDLHFLHARGASPKAMPLVLIHGWPGSFVEMMRIIPMLTDPEGFGGDANDAFEVIVPSLPGFGLSGRPTRPGMSPSAIADVLARLMAGLGHERFGAQGGDIGSSVSVWLARNHPERVRGLHLNMLPGSLRPANADLSATPLSTAEQAFVAAGARFAEQEGGYSHIQRTKPQTLGYGLNDSPVGLAAWIVEKFRSWSDCGGDIETAISRDDLLTNISLYWFTQTITSSMRLYRESQAAPLAFHSGERIAAPLGFASFPKDLVMPPRAWAERFFNIAQWTDMPRGGHFAALEQPELLARDIRDFFRPLRQGAWG